MSLILITNLVFLEYVLFDIQRRYHTMYRTHAILCFKPPMLFIFICYGIKNDKRHLKEEKQDRKFNGLIVNPHDTCY